MNKGHKETISTRIISCAFIVLALAVFKPFGLEVWQWQAYGHLLAIFALGMFSCFLTELILKYVVRMPRSYDHGVSYIISRNLRFQFINTPLVSLLICLYRHFVMSGVVEGNKLSLSNYLETLVIIAFLSFAIGLYWRFKFRSRYLAEELEETRLMNEQLKKLQAQPSHQKGRNVEIQNSDDTSVASSNQTTSPSSISPQRGEELEDTLTLTGTTNESVTLNISNLLYIEAVGNYVKILSLKAKDNASAMEHRESEGRAVSERENEVHTNMLRATMKQMEDLLQAYPTIVRCHRAFMVNLSHVEQISSNSRAMQLVMRYSNDAIPVSRSNVSKLKELLR